MKITRRAQKQIQRESDAIRSRRVSVVGTCEVAYLRPFYFVIRRNRRGIYRVMSGAQPTLGTAKEAATVISADGKRRRWLSV